MSRNRLHPECQQNEPSRDYGFSVPGVETIRDPFIHTSLSLPRWCIQDLQGTIHLVWTSESHHHRPPDRYPGVHCYWQSQTHRLLEQARYRRTLWFLHFTHRSSCWGSGKVIFCNIPMSSVKLDLVFNSCR